MTEQEIIESYRAAENKPEQLLILMDSTKKSMKEINNILMNSGDLEKGSFTEKRFWTESEIHKLKEFVSKGFTVKEISMLMHRSVDSINHKKLTLKLHNSAEIIERKQLLLNREIKISDDENSIIQAVHELYNFCKINSMVPTMVSVNFINGSVECTAGTDKRTIELNVKK